MNHRTEINARPSIILLRSLAVAVLMAWWALSTLPANAQSGGDYVITKSTIDGGGIRQASGGDYVMSGTIGQHDASELSGGNYYLIGGFWSPAGVEPPPDAPTANPDGLNRARFITFRIPPPVVATSGTATAIRVELASIASPPGAPAGTQVRYVNAVGFDGSNHGAMVIDCGDAPTHCPNFACAVLGCEPEYRDWAAEVAAIDSTDSVIHVTGDAVVPSSVYSVMHESKGGTPSSPLPVQSGVWGDVVAAFGVVNVTDLSAVKDWLVELSSAPCKSRVWMRSPVNPFADANVLDLSNVANVLAGSANYSGPPISVCP